MSLGKAIPILLGVVLMAGCATTQIDWDRQVGQMNFDQAVDYLGPPDKSDRLDNGKLVAEWISRYGTAAPASADDDFRYHSASEALQRHSRPADESVLRLTFGTNNILTDWSKN